MQRSLLIILTLAFGITTVHAADPSTLLPATELRTGGAGPLPSWNDGAAKKSVVEFVAKVIKEGSADFVPPAEREWTYDQQSSIGRLDKALDEAKAKGCTVVDMKNDWRRVFAFEK